MRSSCSEWAKKHTGRLQFAPRLHILVRKRPGCSHSSKWPCAYLQAVPKGHFCLWKQGEQRRRQQGQQCEGQVVCGCAPTKVADQLCWRSHCAAWVLPATIMLHTAAAVRLTQQATHVSTPSAPHLLQVRAVLGAATHEGQVCRGVPALAGLSGMGKRASGVVVSPGLVAGHHLRGRCWHTRGKRLVIKPAQAQGPQLERANCMLGAWECRLAGLQGRCGPRVAYSRTCSSCVSIFFLPHAVPGCCRSARTL